MEKFLTTKSKPKKEQHLPVNITASERARQYQRGTFHASENLLFCSTCNVVVDHLRKYVVDRHLQSSSHQVKAERKDHKGDNAYTLNDRLFAVPIHGPETSCSVCHTKREFEYETEGSYVRVSVPRSSLLSPYRFKPHRRSSFDPTDAMSLSSHCLAGWESSKPTVVPMPSSLDLRTSLHQSRTTLDASRAGRYPGSVAESTEELLNRSHSLRYGLQVLEQERGRNRQSAHTTPYPML